MRFQKPKDWKYLVVDEKSVRQRCFLVNKTLNDISPKQRKSFADHLSKQELKVGRPDMIVWVADVDEVPWRDGGLREIVLRMGLPQFEGEDLTIVLEYDKDSVGKTFHVPRIFDGIDYWPFELQADCSSLVGVTKPLDNASSDSKGFAECVHRSTHFQAGLVGIEVRLIDD